MDTQPAENGEQASGANENLDTITRSSDYWFEDGSIILHAESTQFRVHRSMLARHSTVFRDMFEIPQPAGDEPVVEGCLIVHVSDRAADVGHMLFSLYDKRRNRERPTFAQVSASLRLGKKYDIGYQYEEALRILHSDFPSTVHKWLATPSTSKHIKNEKGLLFDIINLALDTNTLPILPAAYLTLVCDYSTDDIITGIERKDGSRATLPPDIQLACIRGRDRVFKSTNLTFAWLPRPGDHDHLPPFGDSCPTVRTCTDASLRCVVELWGGTPNALDCFNDLDELIPFRSFCDDCKACAVELHEIGREEAWTKLPLYFGLPPWAELLS